MKLTQGSNHWIAFQRQARRRQSRINGEAAPEPTGWWLTEDERDPHGNPSARYRTVDFSLHGSLLPAEPEAVGSVVVDEIHRWDDDGGAANSLAYNNARLAILEPDDAGVRQAAESRFPFPAVANARQTSTGFLIQMSPRVQTIRVSGETVALAERSDEAGEETGWSDLNRNLIRELARRLGSLNRLHGMLRRARFHGELRECWRDLRRQEQDLVARLRRLLLGSFQDTTQ